MLESRVFLDGRVTLYPGDCLEVLDRLPANSVDAVITDPPYHFDTIVERFGKDGAAPAKFGSDGIFARASAGFMGKDWDGGDIAFRPETWAKVLRVLKPGGHLAAFSAPKCVHKMAFGIEAAGFEVRDRIINLVDVDEHVVAFLESLTRAQADALFRLTDHFGALGEAFWTFGTGFPKSHDVAQAIDKLDAYSERRDQALRFTKWMRSTGLSAAHINDLTGTAMGSHYLTAVEQPAVATREHFELLRTKIRIEVPSWVEEIIDQRTVESENFKSREVVGQHSKEAQAARWRADYGGGSVAAPTAITAAFTPEARKWEGWGTALKPAYEPIVIARKPLAESSVGRQVLKTGTGAINVGAARVAAKPGDEPLKWAHGRAIGYHGAEDRGSCAALARDDGRFPANLTHDGSAGAVAGFPGDEHRFFYTAKADAHDRIGSGHPTVKPLDLMQWLCRMLCPPGGTILDLFGGTGTTGEAAFREGFDAILIERDPEYQADIARRLEHATAGPVGRSHAATRAKTERQAKAGATPHPVGIVDDLFGD